MNLDIKKHYPKDWIVLQNRVVECYRSMSLDEKRLFIMATPLARTTKISSNDPIFISSSDFSKECGINLSTAYTALESATDRLFTRFFADEVLLLLREFDALNPYTKYKKEVVLRLKKDYSLDLYHLAKKHQTMGGFQISLDELFEQLGLPESYRTRMNNLKSRVIDPSLDEITANTDIDLSYENVKRGRSVVGFKFTVKEKPKPKVIETGRDPNTPDLFHKMTESQLDTFSSKLSELPEVQTMAHAGEDMKPFIARIRSMLKDPEKQKTLLPHLAKLGFKSK